MTRALFIIDVQNDFVEGGALGVSGGVAVAVGITRLLSERADEYDHVFASRDWHDGTNDNGGHFASGGEPDFVTTWPVHCVAGTAGAEYHPALDVSRVDVHVKKGQGKPAYSIFQGIADDGSTLDLILERLDVTEIDVVGIATDYCVLASAQDALDAGRNVRILQDLVAGVDPQSSEAALLSLEDAGAVVARAFSRGSTALDG